MLPFPFAFLQSHSSALPLPPFLVPCTSDHGNPGAWHGTSTAALATTVACGGARKWHEALYLHEYVFVQFIALADTLGCTWDLFSLLCLSRF